MADSGSKISAAQKQALLDNLRLEVTERARSLRSQYSVIAQSLHSRVELRINRIPRALRTQIMGDLIAQYAETLEIKRPKPVLPLSDAAYSSTQNLIARIQSPRKRSSDDMTLGSDKENVHMDLPNPKRRKGALEESSVVSKSTTLARNPSKKAMAAQVLSPKNSNSRTYPASPSRTGPPVPPKRAGSPAKTDAATMPARVPGKQPKTAGKTATTGSVRGKRSAATTKTETRTRAASNSSENSTTTIVAKKKTGGIMGKVASVASAARKKPAATTAKAEGTVKRARTRK